MNKSLKSILHAATASVAMTTAVLACDEQADLSAQWQGTDKLVAAVSSSHVGQEIKKLGLGEFYAASLLRCVNSPTELGFYPNIDLIDMGTKQKEACEELSAIKTQTPNDERAITKAKLGLLCGFVHK